MMRQINNFESNSAPTHQSTTNAKPVFGQLEAKNVCDRLSLTLVDFGRYLVVMRSAFDVMISGEPHIALMLLMDMGTGSFFTRIWNQTVTRGHAIQLEEFVEACETFFADDMWPCLGLPEVEDAAQVAQDFLISQTPVPRKISKTCQKVVRREAGDKLKSCGECLKLVCQNDYKQSNDCKAEVFPDIEPKVELVEEGDEAEYDDDALYDPPGYLEDKSLERKKEFSRCPKCRAPYMHKVYMRVHMMTEHFRGVFRCPQCDFKAFYAQELVEHARREGHPDNPQVWLIYDKDVPPTILCF